MNKAAIKKTIKRFIVAALCGAILSGVVVVAAWLAFPFPVERLQRFAPNPTVSDAQDRHMLSLVSSDQQWCTPIPLDKMSPWLVKATIAVEDRRFYDHPGVDALAICRAAIQNITHRRVVSGASTLTMQVCRMIDDRPRTLINKSVEAFRALQLDRLKSKDDILEIYLNTAPYGGNLRGVEAASVMYFSRHACDLSLPEAALLVGLPKSPTRYNPRKHLTQALKRQKTVLGCMAKAGMISTDQYQQARNTPVVINELPRNRHATHAAWMALKQRPHGGRTCIDLDIQRQLEYLCLEHLNTLPAATELAVVVIDIHRSAIVALLGSGDPDDPVDGQVNGALAKRSPGSALKPFIYAAAFEAGRLAPQSIVYDVPVNLSGWQPSNFDRTFKGPLSAADALRQSLNSPALQVARGVGISRCTGLIEACGILRASGAHRRAGLALVVGGAEVSLLDLTNAYACLGRNGTYTKARLFVDETTPSRNVLNADICSAINHILSSSKRIPRGLEALDPQETGWFMWKTGTSSGRRDAWAVGHNAKYAIGVWVGRFRGTGRIEYVGARAAEPLLAQLFVLPEIINDIAPLPPTPLTVTKPLPIPSVVDRKLQITCPAQGDTFLAVKGATVIRPAVNTDDNVTWFLNDRLLPSNSQAQALNLSPGRYKLHCINKTGRASTVSFQVK